MTPERAIDLLQKELEHTQNRIRVMEITKEPPGTRQLEEWAAALEMVINLLAESCTDLEYICAISGEPCIECIPGGCGRRHL